MDAWGVEQILLYLKFLKHVLDIHQGLFQSPDSIKPLGELLVIIGPEVVAQVTASAFVELLVVFEGGIIAYYLLPIRGAEYFKPVSIFCFRKQHNPIGEKFEC